METVAVVESDKNCRKLLAAKFPKAAQFDDVRTVGRHNLPACDVVVGGFPCQDLSVAGPRTGLAGERSGLFYQLTRITHELQPAFLVWENVPGLLSSNRGLDFLAVLVELDRIGYVGGWRILDAQHCGVAQRRRRIFGVFARVDVGAERCFEILSIAQGLRWNPPPGRGSRERVAGTLAPGSLGGGSPCGGDGKDGLLVAGTLSARTKGGGGLGTDFDLAGGLQVIADPVCSTVTSKWAKGAGGPAGDECQNLIAFSCKDSEVQAGPLSTTLRRMNHDKSHANGGGGQVAVAIAECVANGRRAGSASDVSQTLTGESDGDQRQIVAIPDKLDARVRRLTPRECERLQGFPDDWTSGFADATRYRMIGNAVAVPCAEWIGRRMVKSRATL